VNGETTTVTNTAVAADFHEATNVALNLSAQVAFHLVVAIENLTETADFGFRKVTHLGGRVDTGLFDQLVHIVLANTVQSRKRINHRLVAGEINTCYTRHASKLTLSLLVLWHFANHSHNAVALNDFALVANLFNTRSNFHILFFRLVRLRYRSHAERATNSHAARKRSGATKSYTQSVKILAPFRSIESSGMAKNFLVALADAENDPAHRQIVRAQLHANPVTGQNSDVVHPHLAANVGQDLVIHFVQLYAKPGVGQVLKDRTLELNAFLLIGLRLILRTSSCH